MHPPNILLIKQVSDGGNIIESTVNFLALEFIPFTFLLKSIITSWSDALGVTFLERV